MFRELKKEVVVCSRVSPWMSSPIQEPYDLPLLHAILTWYHTIIPELICLNVSLRQLSQGSI